MAQRKFPKYSYVPGKFPHPVTDPKGHSYQQPEEPAPTPDPKQWRENEQHLYAVALFNRGYYWEAHETWESLWLAAGAKGELADFFKGLIKLAAAGVKAREGRSEGVRRHAQRAGQLLEQTKTNLASGGRFMGIDLDALIGLAQRLTTNPEASVNTSDEPVVCALPLVIEFDTPPT